MFNRNFNLILISNIILGAAMPMLIILGALAGAHLAPSPFMATVAPSVQILAGIFMAAPISIFMGKYGRKSGFLVGALLVVSGGEIGVFALQNQSFLILCAAHFLLGAALVCLNYFRFAAAESVAKQHMATATSLTLASGIVAAFVGPAIFSIATDAMAPIPFAGAYLAISALGLVGILPVLSLAGALKSGVAKTSSKPTAAWRLLLRRPAVGFAIGSAALSQGIMILLMVPTPLAMVGCGFAEGQAADVIRWHVIAMFAPGFFTGPLIRHFGAVRIIATGFLILATSLIAAISGLELWNFYTSLILLGLGWNFGFIGASHLLQSTLSPEERPLIQGINDTLIAVSSFGASLLSGILFAAIGWLAIIGATMPLLLLACIGLWYLRRLAQKPVI